MSLGRPVEVGRRLVLRGGVRGGVRGLGGLLLHGRRWVLLLGRRSRCVGCDGWVGWVSRGRGRAWGWISGLDPSAGAAAQDGAEQGELNESCGRDEPMGSNTPSCSPASPTFTACGQEPNHGCAAAYQLRRPAGKVAAEAGPSATAAVRSARTSQHACRLRTLLLAQGEELLRLALNDLAELGDQVLRIGVRRHARRKREARAIAHPCERTCDADELRV